MVVEFVRGRLRAQEDEKKRAIANTNQGLSSGEVPGAVDDPVEMMSLTGWVSYRLLHDEDGELRRLEHTPEEMEGLGALG